MFVDEDNRGLSLCLIWKIKANDIMLSVILSLNLVCLEGQLRVKQTRIILYFTSG